MMTIDLGDKKYVDMFLLPPGKHCDCCIRLEFGDYREPDPDTIKAFSISSDQLGQLIGFLQEHSEHEFLEFEKEAGLIYGAHTTFRFVEGGNALIVTDKDITRTISLGWKRLVLLEALKHCCVEALRG